MSARHRSRLGNPPLLVVCGPPAAGKSPFAVRLAAALRMPLLSKDSVKEAMMDVLPVETLERSFELGGAAYALATGLALVQLGIGVGVILEGAFFRSELEEDFRRLYAQSRAALIYCSASPDELVRRYRARAISGYRHPGHYDKARVNGLLERLVGGQWDVPMVPEPILLVDTAGTSWKPSQEEAIEWARRFVEQSG